MNLQDFNDAKEQRSFDVIPAGTIATLQMKIRPGGAGEGGCLRRSKAGDSEALDCEFAVVDGDFKGRKFWMRFTLEGRTPGHAAAQEISRTLLRAILESARGITPHDKSDAARKARQTNGWEDFNGIKFIGKIGIEPAQGQYPAKNTLLEAITPNRKEWHQPDNAPAPEAAPATQQPAAATNAIARPEWAK
jgi:hypothetical protein